MSSIRLIIEKIKGEGPNLWFILMLLLVGGLGFGLGRWSGLVAGRTPLTIEYPPADDYITTEEKADSQPEQGSLASTASSSVSSVKGIYVASKTSNKYHLPWCSGAQRIKEENKIWFATKAAAEAAGYQPAGNCPGLK